MKRASKEMVLLPQKEKKRNEKYSEELVLEGYVSSCVPLVIEHFGRWAQKQRIFCSICHNSQ